MRHLAVHFEQTGMVWETILSEKATYYLAIAMAIVAIGAI
jgi:hypothetical protein